MNVGRREVFADANFWIARMYRGDSLHQRALQAEASLQNVRLVTTEGCLVELVTHFSKFGELLRITAARVARRILEDPTIDVLMQDRALLLAGLDYFERRADKGYSLVDCMSMQVMRERAIWEVLTDDHHFRQEGFTCIL